MATRSEKVGAREERLGGTTLLLLLAAGFCWALALALLALSDLAQHEDLLAPPRLLFYGALLLAGLLTFVPLERNTGLTGLALEGIGGTSLLLYSLAFVPPPTEWLLWLPDTPVYLLFAAALFLSVSALAQPLIYLAGKRLFASRLRQNDQRRVRRQGRELGLLAALSSLLAGLRVLTPISFLLLALILITLEIMFLARVTADPADDG
jgi:hypothetical protein